MNSCFHHFIVLVLWALAVPSFAGTPQAITFPEIPEQNTSGGAITLGATASSALPVSYSVVSTAGIVTLNGSSLSLTGTAGSVTVRASQAGDATYDPAPEVFRTFVVGDFSQRFVKIASGEGFYAGIRANGTLWMWGANHSGQLGDGTLTTRGSPVQIGGAQTWTAVACGPSHTMAIRSDGALFAWGGNGYGQLGDGTMTSSSTMKRITSSAFLSVSCGVDHTRAVMSDGTLWFWGRTNFTIIGPNPSNVLTPARVDTATNWSSVSCGYFHGIGLRSDGTLWGWGENVVGELGNGTTNYGYSPVQIGSATNWSSVSCSYRKSAALRSDGTLWTWGANDGRLGSPLSPGMVGTDTNWSSVACGGSFTAAVRTDGTLWSWGSNENGQLGNGGTAYQDFPARVGDGTSWSAVACAWSTALALQSNGHVWSWGSLSPKATGDDTLSNRSSPMQLGVTADWAALACGDYQSVAVREDGTLWGTGYMDGQVGYYTPATRLTKIGSATDWATAACGGSHNLALRTDGTLWAWGWNSSGQLGNGSYSSSYGANANPTKIGNATNWTRIACGATHSVAVRSDGTLWAWGGNGNGQLGDGSTTNRNTPVQIGSATNWASVACGELHTLALRSDGTLWAWGWNQYGQLGDLAVLSTNTPVQIGSLADWVSVSCGRYHSAAVRGNGTLWTWGFNDYGQLGLGNLVSRGTPVQVGTVTTWKSVVCGGSHTLGTRTDGSLWAWGESLHGRIGTLQNTTHVHVWPARAAQTVTVPALPALVPGSSLILPSISSSGLPVVYTVAGSATLNGYELTVTGPGVVSVMGYQHGDTSWQSAVPVQRQSVVLAPAEIAVEQSGVAVADGDLSDFGPVYVGASASRTFTIRNLGEADLTGLTITVDGAQAGDFTVTSTPASPVPGAASTTFTVRFTPGGTGQRGAVLHLASNDVDESPFDITLTGAGTDAPITVPPASIVCAEGALARFEVSALVHPALSLSYQWSKSGKLIAGATSNTLTFPAVKSTDAAAYAVRVTLGTVFVDHAVVLAVVKPVDQLLVVAEGTSLKPAVTVTGASNLVWRKDNDPPLATTGKILDLPKLGAATGSGIYTCTASVTGGNSMVAGRFDIQVFKSRTRVQPQQNMPAGRVGSHYSHQVLLLGGDDEAPTSYAARNLPTGLTINAKTGFISGIPTVAKAFAKVSVSASNSKGGSSSLDQDIIIAPMPAGIEGAFTARVQRQGVLNDNLGGVADFTVASSGAVSGSLVLGVTKLLFKGAVRTDSTPPRAAIVITRTGKPELKLNLEFDPANDLLATSANLTDNTNNAAITGWRQVWKAIGTPLNLATAAPKLFTLALRPPALPGLPEGDGFGSFTLGKDGKLKLAGRTPDGESFTCSTFAGPKGQILVFQTLHTPKGSVLGTLDIDPEDTGALNADVLTGGVSWLRPVNLKSRVSPLGHGPVDLQAFGARHVPTVGSALILSMSLGDKASLIFNGGGLESAAINPSVVTVDVLAGNKLAFTSGNPGSVKITTLNAATGLFSGTFTLNDNELRTGSFASKKLKRTATFNGVLTQEDGQPVGLGHFLLPEMPRDAASPLPATTPTSSEMRSGSVVVEKKVVE